MSHRKHHKSITPETGTGTDRAVRAVRRSGAALLLAAVAATSCTAQPGSTAPAGPADVAVSGDEAVKALGSELDEAALAAGMSPADAVTELRADETRLFALECGAV